MYLRNFCLMLLIGAQHHNYIPNINVELIIKANLLLEQWDTSSIHRTFVVTLLSNSVIRYIVSCINDDLRRKIIYNIGKRRKMKCSWIENSGHYCENEKINSNRNLKVKTKNNIKYFVINILYSW